MALTLVSFFLILLVLILVHECGHFLSARIFGVKVDEFGIFLPPRIVGFKRKETIYSINWLPLGGFVKLSGEEDPKAPGSLASKSRPIRIITLGAGSLMNLILPIVLLAIALMIPHLASTSQGEVLIDSVQAGSPAYQAGLAGGDFVVSINGTPISSDAQYTKTIYGLLGQQVKLEYKRSGQVHETTITPRTDSVPSTGAVVTSVAPGGGVLVDSVKTGSSAQLDAGIVAGDVIMSIQGVAVNSVGDYTKSIVDNLGAPVKAVVLHIDGKTQTVDILPTLDPPATGVSLANVKTETLPFWSAFVQSVSAYWDVLKTMRDGILATVRGTVPFQVSGPVGIAQATGEVVRLGLSPLLRFAAIISLNLGLMNILPVPALDGGRIVFVVLEWVRRGKRVSPRTENLVHTIGFFLLMAFLVFATWGDITRWISGRSLLP